MMELNVVNNALLLFKHNIRLHLNNNKHNNNQSSIYIMFIKQVAVEAIENIRTVAALTQEDKFHSNFYDSIAVPYKYLNYSSLQ